MNESEERRLLREARYYVQQHADRFSQRNNPSYKLLEDIDALLARADKSPDGNEAGK